jgi:uncharacterized membrane protein YvbJ
MSASDSWDKTCPICFKLLSSRKKVCLHCGFDLEKDQDSIKEKREEYIKFRRGKPNPIELKEKIITAVALLTLVILMLFIWYRQR